MIAELRRILEFTIFKIKDYEISVIDLLIAFLIIAGSRLIVWFIQKFLQKNVYSKGTIDEGRQFAFTQLIKYFVYTIAVLMIFQALGISVSLLLAGSAALLVGVGLGLQQTFNDLVSGLILLFEGNVRVGDIIEIDTLIGRVIAIGVRTSKVETRDNVTIIVPNSKFIVDNVINWSHNKKMTRFTISVRTSYSSDPVQVKQSLLKSVKQHRDVVDKPAPIVRLQDFGEIGLHFDLLFWTHNIWRIESLKSEIRFSILKDFKENNITIPFPQRDLHIKSNGNFPWAKEQEQAENSDQ
ncbi:mechanosensitive ion channel [Rhodocytophaga aerolata]|uniref:Mechanosensitive ion channel n=1 Tax=Rhodocytophaga aerolata TaxID=455078 RepID=A0ABT8RB59_9BACT|nr:mechanosensitive ion channel domain-containing protein [Rhodocytophaga aerolata]MDO1447987.1 mechanosensitive ion channel [Rhodocytophaga aerolata]